MAIHTSNSKRASLPNRLITRLQLGVNLLLTTKQSESLQRHFYIKILVQYRLLYPIRQRLSAVLLLLPVDRISAHRSVAAVHQLMVGYNRAPNIMCACANHLSVVESMPAQTISFMDRLNSTPPRFLQTTATGYPYVQPMVYYGQKLEEVFNVHTLLDKRLN